MSFIRTIAVVVFILLPMSCQNVQQNEGISTAFYQPLPTLREQAVEQQEWLKIRLERVLPQLMLEYETDMWILSMREYAEDPVFGL